MSDLGKVINRPRGLGLFTVVLRDIINPLAKGL
jgi:hypothetical protein